jgi:hypothetical protein
MANPPSSAVSPAPGESVLSTCHEQYVLPAFENAPNAHEDPYQSHPQKWGSGVSQSHIIFTDMLEQWFELRRWNAEC